MEDAVRQALDETSDLWEIPVEVFRVEHTYVAGEETALVRAIEGGPALPTAKPPRPFESGIGGAPTLVQNVETLAHVALVARGGSRRHLPGHLRRGQVIRPHSTSSRWDHASATPSAGTASTRPPSGV